MGNSKNTLGEEFGNEFKLKEQVKYKGELRIIGVVHKDLNKDSATLGYVVMIEKTKAIKVYTEMQVKILLSKGIKFVNAELQNGNITNTECTMSSLPVYNTDLKSNNNKYITILGEIYITNNKSKEKEFYKYRILLPNNKIVDITEAELIKLFKTTPEAYLVNAKIVNKNGKYYISAIKGHFTEIIATKIEIKDKEKESLNSIEQALNNEIKTPARLSRERIYRTKVMHFCREMILRSFLYPYNYKLIIPFHIIKIYKPDDYTGNIDIRTPLSVLNKEILPNYVKSTEDKNIIKKITQKFTLNPILDANEKRNPNKDTILALLAFSQFILNDEEEFNSLFKEYKNKKTHGTYKYMEYRKSEYIYELEKAGLLSKKYKEFYNKTLELSTNDNTNNTQKDNIKTLGIVNEGERPYITRYNYKTYKEIDEQLIQFKTAKDCAQIGFCLTEKNKDKLFITDFGNAFRLKYIGDLIPNYDSYKKISSCLGDVLILAQIEKTLKLNCFSKEEKSARVEIMLAILALYRPDIAKKYINENKDRLKEKEIYYTDEELLPGIDLNENTAFNLSPELKVYYTSGFNVFLNDKGLDKELLELEEKGEQIPEWSKHYKYTRVRYKDAKYINYRTLNLNKYCQHPMLYNELGAVINIIASNRVTPELINKVIGGLRTL